MLKRSSDRELFAPLISQVKAPGRTGSLFFACILVRSLFSYVLGGAKLLPAVSALRASVARIRAA